MALTIDQISVAVFGNKRVVTCQVDFDSSYPAGGESLVPSDLEHLRAIDFLVASPRLGVQFEYDYTNEKLQAFVQGIDTDAAGALTLDDFPITAGVGVTSGSVGLTAADPRFGGLKEVADAEDLSTITDVRVWAFGY